MSKADTLLENNELREFCTKRRDEWVKLRGYLSKCLGILFFLTPISGVQASDPPLSIIGLSTAESKLFIEGTVLDQFSCTRFTR